MVDGDAEPRGDAGDEIGLDADVLVGVPNDPEIRALGAEALYRAYNDGVFGVPFFINRFNKFWGIDRIDDFVQSLTQGATI